MTNIEVWVSKNDDYKLLDSGDGHKLEEVQGIRIKRGEPRAWWKPFLPKSEWDKARPLNALGEKVVDIVGMKAKVKTLSNSKHIGIFPEQESEWQWIKKTITESGRPIKVLNLFGYTGLASLAAASAGAKVTHVDASRTTITWARENQALSGLADAPIRWILDDAEAFVKREVKRGERYDAIILDPPAYGRGPKGQVWKVEEDLPKFLNLCKQVLSSEPLFIILNMYTTELSSLSLKNLLDSMMGNVGITTPGELAIEEESGRILPLSIFAIWHR